MADLAGLMKELESLGTEQTKKISERHGAKEPLFGVSFQNLRTIARKLTRDHELALALWKTGNADARSLATLLVDPSRIDKQTAEAWVSSADYYMLVDLAAAVVAKSPVAYVKAEEWRASPSEFVGQAAWDIIGMLSMNDASVPDAYFSARLDEIQSGIGKAKNRVRHAMNGALIAIGGGRGGLRGKAIAVAKTIGKVVVDHGETGCVTPDAADYIAKMAERALPEGTVHVPRPSGGGRGRGRGPGSGPPMRPPQPKSSVAPVAARIAAPVAKAVPAKGAKAAPAAPAAAKGAPAKGAKAAPASPTKGTKGTKAPAHAAKSTKTAAHAKAKSKSKSKSKTTSRPTGSRRP